MISARFPTPRNVYQERCRQTIRSGDFFRGGWYRTRTAAEATAACGGNREPRLGQRSDFSKPCQGAAEKSANATRTGASRQIPSRFPTPRNVYRDDCRFVVSGTGLEQGGTAAGGAIKAPVGRLKVQRSFVIIKLKEGGHNDFAIFCHSIRYG